MIGIFLVQSVHLLHKCRKILNLRFQSLISKEKYMYNSGHSRGGVRSKTLFTQGEPFSIMAGVMIGIWLKLQWLLILYSNQQLRVFFYVWPWVWLCLWCSVSFLIHWSMYPTQWTSSFPAGSPSLPLTNMRKLKARRDGPLSRMVPFP